MMEMIRALIVDDEKLVRQGMISIMPWKDYNIVVAGDVNSGEKALEFLQQEEIDLLITDLAMPVMSGIELIKKVKELYPHIWIVVLTFHQDFGYVQEVLRLGAIDYILKTQLEKEQLGEVLERIVHRIENDRSMFEARRPEKPREDGFTKENGLVLFGTWQDTTVQIFKTKPLMSQYRILEVGSCFWLLDGYDSEADGNAAISAILQQFPEGFLVKVRHLNTLDVNSVLKRINTYLKQQLFYEFDTRRKIYEISVCDLPAEENVPAAAKQDLREGWSSLQWIYDDVAFEGLLSSVIASGLGPDKLESIFYTAVREWDRALLLLNAKLPVKTPKGLKFWSDWKMWILEVRRTLWEKTQKPAYSQDIIAGIMKALDCINKDSGMEIKQETVAKAVGMSRGYFSQCFRGIVGVSFNEYVRNAKMDKARFLLVQTNKPVYWISEQIGYMNEKHFSRVFHELTGMLPTEYRNKNRGVKNV